MSETSPGLAVAWRIAATEAGSAGYPRIECAHLLMGILSLDKATARVMKDLGLDEGQMDRVASEQAAVLELFGSTGVSPRALRRDLRSRVKRKPQRPKGLMSRSTAAKAVFARAETLAAGRALNSIHLLSVLLRDPDPVISSLLVAHGLGPDVADRAEAAAAKAIKRVAIRREPTTARSRRPGALTAGGGEDARQLLAALVTNVRKTHGVLLRFEPEAEALVVRSGFDAENGVRELKRAIERLVAVPLATLAVSGKLAQHPAWKAVHKDGGISFLPE